ncbi:MAG TPA: recombination mediator RecR [bacterium]|nr:recombination mediator RecR [bacterium]HPT29709.1 recombination mediator RecR [bacterium]
MTYPAPLQEIIEYFSKLPGVGPKTAERYAFYLLKQDPHLLKSWGEKLAGLRDNLSLCLECGAVSATTPCAICSDLNRNKDLLCVVASFQDVLSLENTKQYNGRYFILGGLINTIDNIKPEDLRIKQLADKVNELLKQNKKLEIILALSPTLEGETTSLYLAKLLKHPQVSVSKLARGLPSGANLEYADELTLANALKFRNTL